MGWDGVAWFASDRIELGKTAQTEDYTVHYHSIPSRFLSTLLGFFGGIIYLFIYSLTARAIGFQLLEGSVRG